MQKELVEGLRVITRAIPDLKVTTMALPFGGAPVERGLVHTGTWDGQSYVFDGVFLVGAEPAPSPFSAAFDPLRIPRIRSAAPDAGGKPSFGSSFWLDSLDKHRERRYVSDGDPARVSFPTAEKAKLGRVAAGTAHAY